MMSDPLMEFLMSRDRDRVMAEGIDLQKLYTEAPELVRSAIDLMPIGELRLRLATAEAALEAARRDRKVRVQVVGNRELAQMLERSRRKVGELQEINERQARMIADLREQKEAA